MNKALSIFDHHKKAQKMEDLGIIYYTCFYQVYIF